MEKVVGGDWDRLEIEFDECDFFRSCKEIVSAGTEWEQLHQRLLADWPR
jgi:hypothetical protein